MRIFNETPPPEIEDDENYLWHGTSNIFEAAIEGNKDACKPIFSKNDVREIETIYDQMNWCGDHEGGFAVLGTFSKADFITDDRKYFFLGETFQRCSVYASKDFAGGELQRSIYYSLHDLYKYLQNKELRDKHLKMLENENRYCHPKKSINLDGVLTKLDSLKDKYEQLVWLRNSYQYGVVYGFRIAEENYKKLIFRGNMGIICNGIPETREDVVKVKITREHATKQDHQKLDRTIKWLTLLKHG